MTESKKHDCEQWHDEGRGCSICSALIHHTVADAKEIQSYLNAEISRLTAENTQLKKLLKRKENKTSDRR